MIIDFGIFSARFLGSCGNGPYDSTYINNDEDSDLAVRLKASNKNEFIKYKIGDMVGSSLGTGVERVFRGVCGNAYFETDVYCPTCGTKLMGRDYGVPTQTTPFGSQNCAVCGTYLPPNAKFCPDCGTQVK